MRKFSTWTNGRGDVSEQRTEAPARRAASFLLVAFGLLLPQWTEAQLSKQTRERKEEQRDALPEDVESPDVIGEWQVDENGEEFRVIRFDKSLRIEGRDYIRIGDGLLRGMYGMPVRYFEEDEEYFWVRQQRPKGLEKRPEVEPPAPQPAPPEIGIEPRWRFDFTSRSKGLPEAGQWRNGLDIADMNGDGRLDIVHGSPRKGISTPRIFLQQADGSWRNWGAQFPEKAYDYGDAEAADFNGDGKMDLALAMHLRGSAVMIGDGEGRFTSWDRGVDYRKNLNARAWTGRALASEDLDGDGDQDIVVLAEGMEPPGQREEGTREISSSTGLSVYWNQGDGSWEIQRLPGTAFGDSISIGEFGGRPVIAHANRTQRDPRVLWSLASLGDDAEPEFNSSNVRSLARHGLVDSVALGDVDNDGQTELVTAGMARLDNRWWWHLQWHERDEDNLWVGHDVLRMPRQSHLFSVAVGDLDGDGLNDIVAGSDQSDLLIYKGIGEGRFEPVENTLTDTTVSCGARSITLRDLDGDGKVEMIVGFAGERMDLPGQTFEGCTNQGSIHIWTVESASRIEPEAGA